MFGRRFSREWQGWTPPWMQPHGPRGPWGGPGPRGPWGGPGPRGPWGGPHGHWGGPHGWHQPSPEQQAMRSTAAEVARLFMIASRSAVDQPERQAQLRDFLERSRKELTDMIYSSSSTPKSENPPDVEQA